MLMDLLHGFEVLSTTEETLFNSRKFQLFVCLFMLLFNADNFVRKLLTWLKYFSSRRKNKSTAILETGRFDNIDSAVIISRISEAVQNWKHPMTAVKLILVFMGGTRKPVTHDTTDLCRIGTQGF